MPPDGDKNTHNPIRAMFKRASLGTLYGMGAHTLSEYVGVSELRARELLRSHREIFWKFWRWSDAVYDAGISNRAYWRRLSAGGCGVLPAVKSGTLLNWPMQANGAEMLRIACCLATQRGIKIIAPVHDAILVEGPADDINDVVSRPEEMHGRGFPGGSWRSNSASQYESQPVKYPNRTSTIAKGPESSGA